jgi:hypothetical protein
VSRRLSVALQPVAKDASTEPIIDQALASFEDNTQGKIDGMLRILVEVAPGQLEAYERTGEDTAKHAGKCNQTNRHRLPRSQD